MSNPSFNISPKTEKALKYTGIGLLVLVILAALILIGLSFFYQQVYCKNNQCDTNSGLYIATTWGMIIGLILLAIGGIFGGVRYYSFPH